MASERLARADIKSCTGPLFQKCIQCVIAVAETLPTSVSLNRGVWPSQHTDCLLRAQQQNRCLCLGWAEFREIPRDVVKRTHTFISLWHVSFHPIPLPKRNLPPPAHLEKGSGTPLPAQAPSAVLTPEVLPPGKKKKKNHTEEDFDTSHYGFTTQTVT